MFYLHLLLSLIITYVYNNHADSRSTWLKSMSLSIKYLILASYISGSNTKQSDAHIFGVGTRGKRKRSRRDNQINHTLRSYKRGDDSESNTNNNNNNSNSNSASNNSNSASNNANSNNGANNNIVDGIDTNTNKYTNIEKLDSKYYNTPRIFNLERIFGIFLQIACYCGLHSLSENEIASLSLRSQSKGYSYNTTSNNTNNSNNNTNFNNTSSNNSNNDNSSSSSFTKQNRVISSTNTKLDAEEIAQIFGHAQVFSNVC